MPEFGYIARLAKVISSHARQVASWAAILIVLFFVVEAHFWWFSSVENLLGCDQHALWCASNQHKTAENVTALENLKLIVKPNAVVTIGRRELAQAERSDTAEERHVEFSMPGGGIENVLVKNLAHERRLGLTYLSSDGKEAETVANRWYLLKDDVVRVGPARMRVTDINSETIALSVNEDARGSTPRLVTFGRLGFRVGADAASISAPIKCRAIRKVDQLLNFFSEWFDPLQALAAIPFLGRRISARPLRLSVGGPIDCTGMISHLRIGQGTGGGSGAVRIDSVQLVRADGQFYVAPGMPPGGRAPAVAFERAGASPVLAFSGIAWRLKEPRFGDLSELVIGRTTYSITARDLGRAGVELTLQTRSRVNYFEVAATTGAKTAPAERRGSRSRTELPEYVPQDGIVARRMMNLHPVRDISASTYLLGEFSDREDIRARTTLSGRLQKHESFLHIGVALAPLLLWFILSGYVRVRSILNWSKRVFTDIRYRVLDSAGDIARAREILAPLPVPTRSLQVLTGLVATTLLALAPSALAAMKVELAIDHLMALTIANWLLASIGIVCLSGGGFILSGFWLSSVILAAVGNIFLAAMAMDGNSSYWASYFFKNKFLFLDILPPWIWTAATIEPRVIRPWLQKLIGHDQSSFWMSVVRWAPVGALFAAMLLWLFFGGQTGVEGFNPVEFGKFASSVILAAFLVGLDPIRLRDIGDNRLALLSRSLRWILFVLLMAGSVLLAFKFAPPLHAFIQDAVGGDSLAINVSCDMGIILVYLALFWAFRRLLGHDVGSTSLGFLLILATASLFAVPAAQSDWSPLLIMLLQGAIVFACYCFVSAFRWGRFELQYAFRRFSVPARFLPLPTLYGAELIAILFSSIFAAAFYVWAATSPVALLIVFELVLFCFLEGVARIFGRYAITNVIALLIPPVAIAGLVADSMASGYLYILAPLIAVFGIAATFVAAKLSGWEIRPIRWNRLAAIWPIIGVVVLFFGSRPAVDYALKFIGIQELKLDWSRQEAMDHLKEDYADSSRPAIVGRFISWADTRLSESGTELRYWDWGLQVIRSRAVIAAAACDVNRDVTPSDPIIMDILSRSAAFGQTLISLANPTDVPSSSSCGPLIRSDAARARETPLQRVLFDGSDPLRVPVVQFDFPAAYLIGRFGVGFAWILVAVQAGALLFGLLGFLQVVRSEHTGDIDARVRRLLSIVLLSSVTLFALHWFISWSNALGLLPVMGQSMSWLSAGVSHQILMVFPCLIATIVAMRYGRFSAFALRFRMPPR